VACPAVPYLLSTVACPAVPYFIANRGLSGCTVFYCELWPVRLYRILLPTVACPGVPYFIVNCGLSGCTVFFPHFLKNGTNFEKNVVKHKMCVLMLYAASV
jgi:hypothetical protein